MDFRWTPIGRDSKREVKVILHPTASLWEVRRGADTGSDDSLDLTEFVKTASHTSVEASVTFSFNRELFAPFRQPRPNQVLEIQLLQGGVWQPVWLGIVDSLNSFTLQRGERSVQLIAKSRDSQDIWRKSPRTTPLFPQLTDLTYIAKRIALSAGMQIDEVILPPSAFTTPHSNTQLADMNAWDMIEQVFIPMGWTPFIDSLGRLRAADRGLQSRRTDIELTDDRIVKVGGQRQRPPLSRLRVLWLNPTMKKYKKQDQSLGGPVTITMGWWLPYWKHTVWFSSDKTLRATNTRINWATSKSVNSFAWSKFIKEDWIQQGENHGKLSFVNFSFAASMGLMVGLWLASHYTPDIVAQWSIESTGVGIVGAVVSGPVQFPGTPVVPVGRKKESLAAAAFFYLMLNSGTGYYDIWGTPYEWVHARNVSEAFDDSVPTWVDNHQDVESDFIVNEDHARAVATRELIYRARAANKWSVTIVDDPRIEYGDILGFPDGSQLYVEEFTRQLERGGEATLEIKGFLVGPGSAGHGAVAGDPGEAPGGDEGPFPGEPDGGDGSPGVPTIPDYSAVVRNTLAQFTDTTVDADEEDEAKAQLTRKAAWNIYHFQGDTQFGLISKTTGANSHGYSTDKLVSNLTGDFVDIASVHDNGDGTVTVITVWNPKTSTDLAAKWVQPTEAIADLPGPMS